MLFRSNKNRRRGAVLPLVAVASLLIIAYLTFAVDVNRSMLTVRKLEFAAAAAGLYAYSLATQPGDGSYEEESARTRMIDAVVRAGQDRSTTWNFAAAGPFSQNLPPETPIRFQESDIELFHNPDQSASNDLFLQVTARRRGPDALVYFFMPAMFAFNLAAGESLPPGVLTGSSERTVEIVGQPASRVGPGVPPQANGGIRAAELVGWATFPVAISNAQFRPAASADQERRIYTVDLLASTNSQALLPGHLRGCFTNICRAAVETSDGWTESTTAVDQVIALLKYFSPGQSKDSLAPDVVERGSHVGALDLVDETFKEKKQQVLNALGQVALNKYYMLPVVAGDPQAGATAVVVGFARLRLVQAVNAQKDDFALRFEVGDSLPMRNASCAEGSAVVPAFDIGVFLPAPVPPFTPRAYFVESNALEPPPRGVVLAPALSPRKLALP